MAENDKREQILTAARHLILRQGLRATSMEAIAEAARIAKPTLYRYYGDKNAVFAALVAGLVGDMHRAFVTALGGEGTLAERIGAGIAAKYAMLGAYLSGSPFAQELLGEGDRMVAEQLAVADRSAEQMIRDELGRAGVGEPELATRVIVDGAYGIFRNAALGEDVTARLRLLVERLAGSA